EPDDRELCAGGERALGGEEGALELTKLVIHLHAERLEGTGGGVKAGARGNDAAHDGGKLGRARDRGVLTRGDDGAGNPAGVAFLAIDIDEIGQRLFGERVDELRGGLTLAPHAHIERSVGAEGEAAAGVVELRRGNAEIERDA